MDLFVTPEMYGAKGDGATDDTVGFAAAMLNAAQANAELRIVGWYRLQDASVDFTGVTLPAPLRIVGYGGVLLPFNNVTNRLVTISHVSVAGAGQWAVIVRGVEFDVENVPDPSPTGLQGGNAALNVEDTTGVLIEENVFRRTTTRAAKALRCHQTLYRLNRYFDFLGNAALVYGGDDCVMEYEFASGMNHASGADYQTHTFDMSVESPSALPGWYSLGRMTNKRAIIRFCRARTVANTFIQFTGSEDPTALSNEGYQVGFNYIKLDGTTGRHRIADNYGDQCGGALIWFGTPSETMGSSTGQFEISRNRFRNVGTEYQQGRTGDTGASYGLRAPKAFTRIRDNEFLSFTISAIGLTESSDGIEIDGNIFDTFTTIPIIQAGVTIHTNLQITRNTFKDISKSAIGKNNNSAIMRSGNILSNEFRNVAYGASGSVIAFNGTEASANVRIAENDFGDAPSYTGQPVFLSSTPGYVFIYENNRHCISQAGGSGNRTTYRQGSSLLAPNDASIERGNTWYGEFTHDFGTIGVGGTATWDITLLGAATTDTYRAKLYTPPAGISIAVAWQAANTVRFTLSNSGASATPGPLAFGCQIAEP